MHSRVKTDRPLVFLLLAGAALSAMLVWLLVAVPSSTIAHAQTGTGTIRVATTGSDAPSCGSAASPCRTVQYAVDQALGGDSVLIATGVYTNPDMGVEGRLVTVDKSLTLAGGYAPGDWSTPDPTANPTILDAEGLGQILYADTAGITVTVSGLTLQRGSNNSLYFQNARLLLQDSAVISTTNNYALYLNNSLGSQVSNSRIAHNYHGIYATNSENLVIQGNAITDNSQYGLYLGNNNLYAAVSDNIVIGNRYGVYCYRYNHYASFSHNTITGNSYDGVTIDYNNDSVTIEANTLSDNNRRGLYLSNSNSDLCTISGNTITGNADDGVYLYGGTGYQLDNNIIARNGGDGLEWRTGSGTMRHNTIVNNTGEAGLWVGSASIVLTNTLVSGNPYGILTTGTAADVQADHTLWYNNGTNTDNSAGGTIATTHDLAGDPLFVGGVDPFTAYHISIGSAAIDAGTAAGLLVDIDGDSRPYDAGYDVGADEYPGVAAPPIGIAVSGPITGSLQIPYTFHAVVTPTTATPPITYLWQMAGQPPVIHTGTWSDSASLIGHVAGPQTITVTATNEGGTVTGTHAIVLSAPAATSFPFYDGFESGVLQPGWLAQTIDQGRIDVSTYAPYAGSYSALLDDALSDGSYSAAALILTIDLTGQPSAVLDFWWREFGDEDHPQDGVFLSDNYGATWYQALSFNGGPQSYRHDYVDLGASAAAHGLTLNDHFQIKFQFYDDLSIPNDGYAIDEVRVISALPLAGVTVSGPSEGMALTSYTFAADVTPVTGTPPINYVWQATEQTPITQTGGVSTEAAFTWTAAGTQVVTVTATNAVNSVSDTHIITLIEPPIIEVAPLAIEETLPSDTDLEVTLTITNNGGSVLNAALSTSLAWLSVSPDAAAIPPLSSVSVAVTLDAAGLVSGSYTGTVAIVSNDPVNPLVAVPVIMHVGGEALPMVTPTLLDFGEVFVGFDKTLGLLVENAGASELTVFDITASDPALTVSPASFTIGGYGDQVVDVTFAPVAPQPLSATLTISTNAPTTPVLTVEVVGRGVEPPAISAEPTTFDVTQGPGLVTTRTLLIHNHGLGTLSFDLSATNGVVSLAPDTGTVVGPGQFASTVTFDSTARPAGLYTGQIKITSNDPLTPTLSIPVVFTVTLAVPEAPSNPNPPDGGAGVRIDKTLAWQASLNATSYDLYLWEEGQSQPVTPTVSSLTQPQYDPADNLPTGTQFHWQVVARNTVGDTLGPEWTFTTEVIPDLEVTTVAVPLTASSGQPVDVNWVVVNRGDGSTLGFSWHDRVYISTSLTLDLESAIYLGKATRPVDLAPGASYSQTATFDLPQGISGEYYAFVVADYSGTVRELDETNNTSAPAGPMAVSLTPPPDLQVTAVSGPANAYAGSSIQVTWMVHNAGTGGTVSAAWYDRIYLSADPVFDAGTDTALKTVSHSGALAASEAYTGTTTVNLPQVISGTHYLFVVTDIYDKVYEHLAEMNNTSGPSDPIDIALRPADLVVTKTSLARSNTGISTSRALAGHPLTYTLTLVNDGQLVATDVIMTDTLPPQVTFLRQSSAISFTQDGGLLVWPIGDLDAGAIAVIDVVGQVATGTVGMIVNQVEATTTSFENNLANNSATLMTTVEIPAPVLKVSPTGPTVLVSQGASADLVVTITNIGAADMAGITVAPPPYIPWVTVDTGGLTGLASDESATITLTASAGVDQAPGYYHDYVTVSEASGGHKSIALTVRVIPLTRTLEVTVENDQGARVPGARLTLEKQEASVIVTQGVTEYYYPSVQGRADSEGVVTLSDVEVGTYDYSLSASDHSPAYGTLTVIEGSGAQAETLTMVALAELSVSPNTPVIGVVQGETAGHTIAIWNGGAAPLTGVAIAPPASLPWVYLSTPATIPPIPPGGQIEFTIFASPPDSQAMGVYQDYVIVTADGGQTRHVALTVEVTVEQARNLRVFATDGAGNPVTTGRVTLIEQALSIHATGGVTTTFNEQFSARLDASGSALLTDLRPGDYNYLISADGYEQGEGTLTVLSGMGTQEVTSSLTPAPFVYEWEVVPIEQGYDITLTLTYDTRAEEPAVAIPERRWHFCQNNPQPVNDTITVYNMAAISLTLTDLDIQVPGVDVQVGPHPEMMGPYGQVAIPVTAIWVGDVARGKSLVDFSYRAVEDEFVTFTFNPSSLWTPVLDPSEPYTKTFLIEPVVYNPATEYAVEVTQPSDLDWITVSLDQAGPMNWTDETDIAATLVVGPPTWLPEGTYTDSANIRVTGDDGTWREGNLVVEVNRTGDGFQVHTTFELGPIPYVDKTGSGSGFITPYVVDCDGEPTPFPEPVIRRGGGGSLIIGPGGGVPSFPSPVPPPVYRYGHQQVRIQISQRMMLEGEGFHATLDMDNISDSPLELVSVDIRLADLEGGDQTSQFTLIPEVPTDLGTVAVGGSASEEWLILPSDLDVIAPEGERYNVQAIINYSWNGATYSVETVPEEITVYPAPDLIVTYELPLAQYTCTVFDIRTIIFNQGRGPARNLRFSSSQPEVVDNESGLAIGFEIIEAYINSVPQGGSLDLVLGDLPPNESVEVIWRLEASLPGRFVEFTSDYRQTNYEGLPLTPLISEINTRFVRPTDPSCTIAQPLSTVAISGPMSGIIGTSYAFTATASPVTATQPITYVWQATDQPEAEHTGGVSDTIGFAWATPGTKAITVTASNIGSTVSDTHVITLSAAVPTTLTLSADPTSIVAGGVSTSTITAAVTDEHSNPVPGQVVTFTTSLGALDPISATTDASGAATTELTAGTIAGSAVVTATADAITGTTTVTLTAGPPVTMTLTVDPISISADGVSTSTLEVTVTDGYGNFVPSQVVTFTTSLGTVAPVSATTDVSGLVTTTLTSSTTVGTAIITATADAVTGTVEVPFTNLPPVVDAGPAQATHEGSAVSLPSAVFTDTNPLDTHTATIDWGDGTAEETATVTESDGTGAVSGSHVYADDGIYSVEVCVTDEHEDTACDTLEITVDNVAPTIEAGGDQTADEGEMVSLDPATFSDPGTGETHTATIDWDDGTPEEAATVVEGDGTGMVAGSHVYADDGTYIIEVCVADNEVTTCDTLTVSIENVVPTVDAGADQTVDEGAIVSLDPATFNDPGTLDTHTAAIDWGDGSEIEAGLVSERPSGPPGDSAGMDGTVDGSHVYADDGIYTVTVCVTDDEETTACDTMAVTIYNVAPAVVVDLESQPVQYSDGIAEVTITATDIAIDPLDAATAWRMDAGDFTPGLPTGLESAAAGCTVSDNTNVCTWTLSGIANVPAAVYTVRITVVDDEEGQTDADITLVVEPENAIVKFHGGNPVAVRVPDGEEVSGPFDLMVRVRETYNWDTGEEPIGEPLTYPGDIGLAQVSMMLSPVGPGGSVSPVTACTSSVADTGYDAKLTVVCSFDSVPVNTYAVQVTVDGDYYTGYGEDVLVVYDPNLGFATGGGSFYWPGTDDAAAGYPGDQTNLGFTMEYNKKGQKVKGSLLLIRHREDDSIYQVKSNALYGLALGQDTDPVSDEVFGWASFSGKSTYLEPGWLEPVGNYEFIVYVEDRNEPGTGVDRFWIELKDKDRQIVLVMSMDREATDHAVDLPEEKGNIVVPHGGGKSRN